MAVAVRDGGGHAALRVEDVEDRLRGFDDRCGGGGGTVTDIVDGGRDYEVTVNFDQAGTKKMFASFAKLKKL